MLLEDFVTPFIRNIHNLADLLVDLRGNRLGVVAGVVEVAAEEHLVVALAVDNRTEFWTETCLLYTSRCV